jgi:hypothetical protein
MSLRSQLLGRSVLGGAVLAAASIAFTGSTAPARTIRFQTGFEPNEYTTGSLIGQNGWARYDADAPLPVVDVQNTVVHPSLGGTQAVKFQTTGAGIDPYADFTDIYTGSTGISAATLALEPLVTIQFDMMRGTLDNGELPTAAWGVDIYDADDSALTATVAAYDDGLGPAVSGSDASGTFVYLGDGSARGTWDTYTVSLNFLTRTYTVALNGTQLAGELDFGVDADAGIGNVDFLALTRGTDAAYFDNLVITTSAVPEPATTGLVLAAAGVVLTGRRRRAI